MRGEPTDDGERSRQFSSVLERFQARLAAAKEKETKEKKTMVAAKGSAQVEKNLSATQPTKKKSPKQTGKKPPAVPKRKNATAKPKVGGRGRGKVCVEGQGPGRQTATSVSQNTRSASSSSSSEARLRKL